MSDFREHARNHLRTAAGTYMWAVRDFDLSVFTRVGKPSFAARSPNFRFLSGVSICGDAPRGVQTARTRISLDQFE